MSEIYLITSDQAKCGGRPRVRGRRLRVGDILNLMAAGVSWDEIPDDYPLLDKGDITAALEYAKRQSDHPCAAMPDAVCDQRTPAAGHCAMAG